MAILAVAMILFLDPTLDFQVPWTTGKGVMIKLRVSRINEHVHCAKKRLYSPKFFCFAVVKRTLFFRMGQEIYLKGHVKGKLYKPRFWSSVSFENYCL